MSYLHRDVVYDQVGKLIRNDVVRNCVLDAIDRLPTETNTTRIVAAIDRLVRSNEAVTMAVLSLNQDYPPELRDVYRDNALNRISLTITGDAT